MEKITVGTPYDDVFRTLLNDCASLIIPVVNEIFGEKYTGDETVEFLQNEHFISLRDADTKEKITDSCFRIKGTKEKKYHIECQSTTDNHMTIRMFEYDSQIALDDGEVLHGKLIVTFPNSAVLYLRHNRDTPDAMTVEIKTPGGSISYEIPVLKTQTYTIKDIFDRNLLFLIPFYIFSYETRFKEYDADGEKLHELQKEYAEIRDRLEILCNEGQISEYTKCTLADMSKRVIENIAARYANVKKGVTAIMGGKVLEYEAKTILQDGIRQGKLEGIRQGKLEGIRQGKLEGIRQGKLEGIQQGKLEGIRQGKLEGIRQGKLEGIQQGKLEGIHEGKLESYIELIRDGLLDICEAAKRLNMKEEDLKKYL